MINDIYHDKHELCVVFRPQILLVRRHRLVYRMLGSRLIILYYFCIRSRILLHTWFTLLAPNLSPSGVGCSHDALARPRFHTTLPLTASLAMAEDLVGAASRTKNYQTTRKTRNVVHTSGAIEDDEYYENVSVIYYFVVTLGFVMFGVRLLCC